MSTTSTIELAGSMREAGAALLARALDPSSWTLAARALSRTNRCRVGPIEVCAAVDVTPVLETLLRVSFRGQELSPLEAAEHLESFVSSRFPFVPNAEWLVEIDARAWIHFSRRYTQAALKA